MVTAENPVRSSEDLFQQMVEEYSDMAYSVALRMLRKPEDAEDAVQDAFLSAYRAFDRFKGDSKVSTWLYRIVVNACLMKIRKSKRESQYLTNDGYGDPVVKDWSADPESWAENVELGDHIEDAMNRLTPDLRTAIVLRDIHGLSTKESAEVLGIGVTALKSRVHRARVLLRKHLEGVKPIEKVVI